MRAVKQAASRPKASPARTRASQVGFSRLGHIKSADLGQARDRLRAWGRLAGAADVPASATPAPRRRERTPLREYRRHDGSLVSGRLRAWRGA